MTPNQPLHLQVYDAMSERIMTGEWAEGDRLPSERELINEFGTSRGPIRQALARLRSEGLVAGGQGASPRVQKAVPSQSFDSYISFTEWAESLGHEPRRTTIEVARRLADDDLARRVEREVGEPIVIIRRLRMFDDEPVMLEQGYYPPPGGQHLLSVDLDENSIYRVLSNHGIVPARAHNVIDAVPADNFSAHWLGVETGAPLLRLRRTAYDANGSVVDYVENRYLPEKATISLDNTRNAHVQSARLRVNNGQA